MLNNPTNIIGVGGVGMSFELEKKRLENESQINWVNTKNIYFNEVLNVYSSLSQKYYKRPCLWHNEQINIELRNSVHACVCIKCGRVFLRSIRGIPYRDGVLGYIGINEKSKIKLEYDPQWDGWYIIDINPTSSRRRD